MMLTTVLTIMASLLVVFVGYTLVAPTLFNLPRFLPRFAVDCPTHHRGARVNVKAVGASLSAAYGTPRLHVRRCTLLHPGERCDEACLGQCDKA